MTDDRNQKIEDRKQMTGVNFELNTADLNSNR